jgi:hypothetical protein
MFEDSPLAPQHWMRLIHHRILGAQVVADDELARLGVDSPMLEAMFSRLGSVLKREGIAPGSGLQAALKAKDRELVNNQFARNMIHYMEMEAARDGLLGTISCRILLRGQLFPQFLRRQFEQLPEAHVGHLQAEQTVRRPILAAADAKAPHVPVQTLQVQ